MKPKTTTRYFIIQVKHETLIVLLLSISVKKKKMKSCGKGCVHISNIMHSVRFMSPICVTVTVPNSARPSNRISCIRIHASLVDSSSDFVKRMELAWSISQQSMPIACTSCNSKGHTECKWCGGTGFFIIGDNMLCEVPSRNTSCVVCRGKGSRCCSDCQGTGFRAKWLKEPPTSK
ncbi:hypothetical protein JHK82_039404 [Glycine max]|nr:protein PHOTOSYSTEM I ASSEMBLY 2, chloroplastic isoform X2 [Glycine max]KAG4382556.1 hypothetical protein GLYMA_14G104200v4 [Glycine max]KAG5110181.1 hypothetical protein JHK82_039404 [Glycine max]KAG5121469.1 hypothetical protein JHK84_039809 [Glycine max]|eukprot:XP_003544568.2 protein PHOTOSYSTEM I ASSEMBLY 2, chloroplastic [Glycine max]